jgi:hypothetical protein
VRISRLESNRVTFTIAADDTRPVAVETSGSNGNCDVRAQLRMLGEWVVPKWAHVEIIDSRPFIPEISHVDLHAVSADGTTVCERLVTLRTAGTRCNATK